MSPESLGDAFGCKEQPHVQWFEQRGVCGVLEGGAVQPWLSSKRMSGLVSCGALAVTASWDQEAAWFHPVSL